MTMRILVLDGNENHAVASVRSLARAGHRVEVGASTSWSKAGWSRDAASRFIYPAPQQDALAFVHCIAEEASREPGTLVLPMTERTTLPLSLHRDVIYATGARLVLPPHETVRRAFDKQETTRLAQSLGVAVPRDSPTFYFLCLAVLVLTIVGTLNLLRSPTGRATRTTFHGTLAAISSSKPRSASV